MAMLALLLRKRGLLACLTNGARGIILNITPSKITGLAGEHCDDAFLAVDKWARGSADMRAPVRILIRQ